VEARHAAFDARVVAYEQAANAEKDSTNDALQSVQDRIDREAEANR
jgi:hypothetical protein